MNTNELREIVAEIQNATSIAEIEFIIHKAQRIKMQIMEQVKYKALPYLKISTELYEPIEDVPNAQLGKLFKMLFLYSMDSTQIVEKQQQLFNIYNADPELRQLFKLFRKQLDKQIEAYKRIRIRNAQNGLKGGRPHNQGNAPRPNAKVVVPPPTSEIARNYDAITYSKYSDYNVSFEYSFL